MRRLVIGTAIVLFAACSRETVKDTKESASEAVGKAAKRVSDAFDVTVPAGKPEPAVDREQQRFDERWRQLESFRERAAAILRAQNQPQPPPAFRFVPRTKETFKDLDARAINDAPLQIPVKGDVKGPTVLKAQVWLDRIRFSVGAIDGRWGRNSAITVWWYQQSRGLDPTGVVDEPTFRSIAAEAAYVPALVEHRLTGDEIKGPFVTIPEDVYEKEKLDCLCYESVLEKLGEQFHADVEFLEQLNPDVNFASVKEGDVIVVPNVRTDIPSVRDIARVVVSIAGNSFNGFDAAGNLIFHAPTTLGSGYDPSPTETVEVRRIVNDPHFHYQPTLFHEVPDTDPEAHLQPGPNSPVGVVWIALSKPHYGVHGTSDPESIGYASSHGCVRLTNWDAREVAARIAEKVPVAFRDVAHAAADKSAAQQ